MSAYGLQDHNRKRMCNRADETLSETYKRKIIKQCIQVYILMIVYKSKKEGNNDMHPKSWTLLEVHIFTVKTGRKNKKYSPEIKISVIIDMREHHLGYSETMRKYFPHLKENCFEFLKKWERIFLEEEAEGLMKER